MRRLKTNFVRFRLHSETVPETDTRYGECGQHTKPFLGYTLQCSGPKLDYHKNTLFYSCNISEDDRGVTKESYERLMELLAKIRV